MQTIQIGKFKANLSEILEKVQNEGEKFIIEYGKKRKKIAMLIPYKEERKKRKFGQLKGKITIPEDFDEENKEINKLFYGN